MSNDNDWEKLTTESKVVSVGRPVKKPDGGLNPVSYTHLTLPTTERV